MNVIPVNVAVKDFCLRMLLKNVKWNIILLVKVLHATNNNINQYQIQFKCFAVVDCKNFIFSD